MSMKNPADIMLVAIRRADISAIEETLVIEGGKTAEESYKGLRSAMFHTRSILTRNASNIACGMTGDIFDVIRNIDDSAKALIDIALKTKNNPIDIALDTMFIGMYMNEINPDCDICSLIKNMLMRDADALPYDAIFAVDMGLYSQNDGTRILKIRIGDISKRIEQAVKESKEER